MYNLDHINAQVKALNECDTIRSAKFCLVVCE